MTILLIGRQTAINLKILKLGLSVCNIKDNETHVFRKIKNVQVNIKMNKSIKPVCQPYRRVPIPLLNKIDIKISELEKMDIVEKVDVLSEWVSPIVPILKSDGDIRICLDMRQVNKTVLRENYGFTTKSCKL